VSSDLANSLGSSHVERRFSRVVAERRRSASSVAVPSANANLFDAQKLSVPLELRQIDPELFGSPKRDTRVDDSWYHSPEFDAQYRRHCLQQRAFFRGKARAKETIADPDDFQPSVAAARNEYFNPANDKKRKPGGDPRQALPTERNLGTLADTYGADASCLTQALAMEKRGLYCKAKRFILCGRIGRRIDCTGHEVHKFCQPYTCRCRYCQLCGPAWFRGKFTELRASLQPIVEHLLHEGNRGGRKTVVAKLDFTVPNSGVMPSAEFVRQFHADLRRFWRAAERRFGISRRQYGVAGCDEFGGGNTNLHRHCLYVGPRLPQSKARKELSALWSEIRGERSFVSIKHARSFEAALAHALKYPAKFLGASTPERLAELEKVFHRTRRFSAGGAFYNVTLEREPGESSPIGECPLCGARLCEIVENWVSRFTLEVEGRRSVEEVRRELGRAKILSGASPP
jgi:hypothetical protein